MDSSNAGTSTFQSCFYFFVWVYGVIYSAYQLQLSSNCKNKINELVREEVITLILIMCVFYVYRF